MVPRRCYLIVDILWKTNQLSVEFHLLIYSASGIDTRMRLPDDHWHHTGWNKVHSTSFFTACSSFGTFSILHGFRYYQRVFSDFQRFRQTWVTRSTETYHTGNSTPKILHVFIFSSTPNSSLLDPRSCYVLAYLVYFPLETSRRIFSQTTFTKVYCNLPHFFPEYWPEGLY